MDETEFHRRLESLSTHWSIVFDAHKPKADNFGRARVELVHRYRGPIYRYALAIVGNADQADDILQQFAVRLLDGKFHKAHPTAGRFRSYVKTIVVNLIREAKRDEKAWPSSLPERFEPVADVDDQSSDEFAQAWREEVLNQTWAALKATRPVYHDLLRLRLDQPSFTSREMAQEYSTRFAQPMTASNVRKTLERAHTKFADLLVTEIASSIQPPSSECVRLELEQLDLLKYARSALERWEAKQVV